MNQILKIFTISLYVMVILSAVMLALAEGPSSPSWLTVPVAFIAFYMTDSKKSFILPVWAAGFSGIIALVTSLQELVYGDIEARLLSGSHFLIYLNWIILLSEKKNQQYWWLFAVALLQVAIGSVLTKESYYGFLLLMFMVVQIWTLSLFSLKQVRTQYLESHEDFQKKEKRKSTGNSSGAFQQLLVSSPRIQAGLNYQSKGNWINFRFLMSKFSTIFFCVFVAACFYLFIPRLWIGNLSFQDKLSASSSFAISGFSEEVKLEDFALQLSSNKKVLQIKLYDTKDDKELDVVKYSKELGYSEPLFRGSVLEIYKESRWLPPSQLIGYSRPMDVNPNTFINIYRDDPVRQEIVLQPVGSRVLFGLQPVFAGKVLNVNDPIKKLRTNQVLYRPERVKINEEVRYTMYSYPVDFLKKYNGVTSENEKQIINEPPIVRYDSSVPVRKPALPIELSELSPFSAKIAGEGTDKEKVKRLESYLRDSGEFQYQLNAQTVKEDLDPNLDFLFHRKAGYCENFASALTLMIRSLEIPSRLIIGYKGGVVNTITGHFEVEQRHAHAWVEALVDGNWITLDPTPALERLDSVKRLDQKSKTWKDLWEFIKGYWKNNIIELDFSTQRAMIYDPVQKLAGIIKSEIQKKDFSFLSLISAVLAYLFSPDFFATGLGLLTLVILIVLLIIGIKLMFSRNWLSRIRDLFKRTGKKLKKKTVHVDFYERFRKICEKQGIYRENDQTQREYANMVCEDWKNRLNQSDLEEIPEEIAEYYYRVRFGHEDIPESVSEALMEKLNRLENSFKEPIA